MCVPSFSKASPYTMYFHNTIGQSIAKPVFGHWTQETQLHLPQRPLWGVWDHRD